VPEPSCAAMRLLHARNFDVVHRLPRAHREAHRGGAARGAERPHLPLYGRCGHHGGAHGSRRHRTRGLDQETAMNEQAKTKDAKQVYRELVTINGKNVVLAHNEPPVVNAGVLEMADIFRMFNIFDDKFSPTNLDKADGAPLRLYTSDRV